MEKYTSDQLLKLKELIAQLNGQVEAVQATIAEIKKYDIEGLIEYLASVEGVGREEIPTIIQADGVDEQKKALPMVIDKQPLVLVPQDEMQRKAYYLLNRLYNDNEEDIKNIDTVFYEFLNHYQGEGPDTFIISGEMYKDCGEVKFYRNQGYHCCYLLDLYNNDGVYYDKNDEEWNLGSADVLAVITGARKVDATFGGVKNLESVIFLNGVLYLEKEAFWQCSSLANVWLSPTIKKIGDYCFSRTNIQDVLIPESVEYVGCWAFPINTNIYASSKIDYYDSSQFDNLHYIDKEEKKEGTFSKILKNIF